MIFKGKSICIALLGAYLIVAALAIREEKQQQPKTIVEANHFYSATEKRANYNITDIESGKSLVLLLKKAGRQSAYVTDFTVSLQSEQEKVDCNFEKVTDLCIIPKTAGTRLNMLIECKVLPCEASWIIYQPEAKAPSGNEIALNLFSLHDSGEHLMAEITCNDPAVSSLDSDVTVHSESPYRRAYKNNVLYVLFNNEQKGYVFIDIAEKSRACSRVSFKAAPKSIKESENVTSDFVLKDSPVTYELEKVPQTDFRFESEIRRLDSLPTAKSTLTITLLGMKGSESSVIAKHELVPSITRANDCTMVFKKPSGDYDKLKVLFEISTNQMILLQTRLVVGDVSNVELGEAVFFSLKKGEKVSFKVLEDDEAEATESFYLVPRRNSELNLSKSTCSAKTGCEFTATALSDTENVIFISDTGMNATSVDSESGKGVYEFQPIEFITMTTKAKHRLRVGDNVYFRRQIKKGESVQVHINTPNAIMYAACQSKCQVPDEGCRERTGNYHHPFIYEAQEDCTLLINVEGLDNTEFELTVLGEGKYIQLEDGTPFSYTMDSKEERVDFRVKLAKKADVSFNLVSPLNSLKLLVSNEEELPNFDASEQSTDGYIFIEKDLIGKLQFVVSVAKMKEYSSSSTHFTLIVSTKHARLRLEPSVTNYETLLPGNFREFIFEFDPSDRYILSFSAFNLNDQKLDLELKIAKEGLWDDAEVRIIENDIDYVDLREMGKVVCEEEGVERCEIFLRISNRMSVEVDFTVNLLMQNAVLELKDGIWQAFPETLLISTANFYFYPRHEKQNVFISYHSSFQDLRIAYNLWKYDSEDINPLEWPFPKAIGEKEQLHSNFKPNNYVMIDHEQMQTKCWPNCLLLISFYVDYQTAARKDLSLDVYRSLSFRIMASNNQIELPEKQKLSLTVGKNEDRVIFIDLKYALEKEALTFFTSTVIGDCYLRANAFSSQNSACPVDEYSSDFSISLGESELTMQDIKNKLKTKQMEDDKNLYLCLDLHSTATCKMSIEYSSESEGFKRIQTDTYEDISLGKEETKYYQINGFVKQFSKITRVSGFPFILIKKCAKKDEDKQCMESFKNSSEKGKQIVVKTESFEEEVCMECIYLFKFSSVEPAKLNFHLQSEFSQLELKEKTIMSDFLNEGQTNKYMIHASPKEDVILNVHVQEGAVDVQVTNVDNVNLNKRSDVKNRVIHFVIKSLEKTKEDSGKGLINPVALSTDFAIYHVVVKSIDTEKAASYSISYSSGLREVYLQDGLILDYMLQPNKVSTFYYFNELTSAHVFYSLSMSSAAVLNQLKFKSYYLEDPNDDSTRQVVTLEKPAMSKKAPNPTVLYSLPEHNFFIFELTNPGSKEERISMGINHQEVILLPFDHEFPFQLHKGEALNILADVNIPGFLDISIKKCDRAEPSFAYSFDYDGFIKEQFMYETTLNSQPYFHYTVKANRIGTLYINFRADQQDDSTLSLRIVHSEEKSKAVKIRPGRKGILQYELTAERKATVTVPAADCDGSPCTNAKYYYLSSATEQEVYTQLVCSSSFFSTNGFNSSAPLTLYKIEAKVVNKSLTFEFQMGAPSVYLGIKVVSERGEEVFYQPIEVASLWAKWQKVSLVQRSLMVLLVLLFLCICAIFVRRASRKGYRQLDESQE